MNVKVSKHPIVTFVTLKLLFIILSVRVTQRTESITRIRQLIQVRPITVLMMIRQFPNANRTGVVLRVLL